MIQVSVIKYGNIIIKSKKYGLDHEGLSFYSNLISLNKVEYESDIVYDPDLDIIQLNEWNEYIVEVSGDVKLSDNDFANRGYFLNQKIGVLCFENAIGYAFFQKIKLKIESRKLSFDQFLDMLGFVDSHISALIFSNNKSTALSTFRSTRSLQRVDYFIFKYIIANFDPASKKSRFDDLKIIVNNPHRLISERHFHEDMNFAEHVTEDSIFEIFSGNIRLVKAQRSNTLSQKLMFAGTEYLPEEIENSEYIDSYDTQENRFIKFVLKYCLRIIAHYNKNPFFNNTQFVDKSQLQQAIDRINYFINDTVFSECKDLLSFPYHSQVLNKKNGYRSIFNFYNKIKNVPNIKIGGKQFEELLEVKNIDLLYEIFCLFYLNNIVKKLFASFIIDEPDFNIFPKNDKKELNISSVDGKTNITYHLRLGEIKAIRLIFKKHYRKGSESYSLDFDPDFSIEAINQENQICVSMVFDAKFKTKNETVLPEDIVKMHAYKDALNIEYAAVLFPGSANTTYNDFVNPNRGIGAYAINPSSENYALEELILSKIQTK